MKQKTILKHLEKIFSASIESLNQKYPIQLYLKECVAKELLELGYIEEYFLDIQGVKCKFYALSSLGMIEYCSSCKDDEND